MTPQFRESETQTAAVAPRYTPAPVADFFKAPMPAPLPQAGNDNETVDTGPRPNLLSARRRRWTRMSNRH